MHQKRQINYANKIRRREKRKKMEWKREKQNNEKVKKMKKGNENKKCSLQKEKK